MSLFIGAATGSTKLIIWARLLMNQVQAGRVHMRIGLVFSLFVLGGILVAGLWPFHAPQNGVSWLERLLGLPFSGHGSVVSLRAFRPRHLPSDTGFSLEIRLAPGQSSREGSILAIDSSPDPASAVPIETAGCQHRHSTPRR